MFDNAVDQLSYFYRSEIYIETTNCCNIRCRFCINPSLEYPKGMMGFELFCSTVDQIADHPYVKAVNLVGMGETFLHPRIWEMIDYVHTKKLECYCCTNGKWHADDQQLESLVRVKHIHITVDGISNEAYQISRPHTDVNAIWNTVSRIIETKKRCGSTAPHVQVRMNLFAFNRHELFDLIDRCRRMGVDSVWIARGAASPKFQTELNPAEWDSLPCDYIFTSGFSHSNQAAVDDQTGLNAWRHKTANRSILDDIGCNGLTVRWDGTVTPCCFDFNVTVGIGSIRTESLREILSKKRIRELETMIVAGQQERMATGRPIQCDYCTELRTYLDRCSQMMKLQKAACAGDSLQQASDLIRNGNALQAECLLQAVLSHHPHHCYALRLLAVCTLLRGEVEPAKRLVQKAITETMSLSAKLYDDLGYILNHQVDAEKARQCKVIADRLRANAQTAEIL